MFRGAIIGVGKIAQTGHLPAFRDSRISGRAEMIAGVDIDPGSRKLAAERFPGLRLYADIDEMLAKEEIDFIDICTSPASHHRLLEAAVARGMHILCEKPLAVSLEESEAALNLLLCRRQPPLVFMPCHQYRYSALWETMKAFIAGLPPGEGMFVQFNIFRTGADPGLLSAHEVWRLNEAVSGGGILADTGIHYLYLSLWMLGLPRAVTARTHRLAARKGNVEDTAAVVLEYENRLVQISLTWGADRRANSARVTCPSGSLSYDGKALTRTRGDMSELLPVPDAADKSHYVQLYVALLDEFLERLKTGRSGGPDLDEAYQSMRLLDACYTSARSGTTVKLEPAP
ncbi:gfo/Idh/MocA family oxidoreductase [bacterium]|nr:MAG: gfo/Idh/MocA family oxidoreductase [bacterium]